MKKFYLFLSLVALILCVAGCGKTETKLPDLSMLGKITVIAREEGSGTKDAYKLLVKTNEAGANKIAASTNQVMDITSGDKNAIGYMALSALQNADHVKALSIDNIAASHDNIASGKYPLCRQYLIAYKGKLNDLEVDFLTYILGAGQKIVNENCIPVDKVTSFLSLKPTGTITISGSSSVAPLMEKLVADYKRYNAGGVIKVEVSDSSAGLNAALRGDCDLAMSSRPLKDYEKELLETKAIAADGLAVIVNKENPLTGLSLDQVKSIYDGNVKNWTDLK